LISALAITFNEVQNVEAYLERLSFADEIIIVDSFSSDGTKELAEKMGARVVQRKFDHFSNQRNFALSLAKHDWVVFFDLDERINNDLVLEIKEKVNSQAQLDGYYVKRQYFFFNQRIKYSGFQTDWSVRLFKKSTCTYDGNFVHEEIKTTGQFGRLENAANHYSFSDFDRYNQKLTQYSKLQAEVLFDKGVRPNLFHFLVRPSYRFFTQYFWRLGLLDGKAGFILAYVHSFAVFKRYAFLWLKYRGIE